MKFKMVKYNKIVERTADLSEVEFQKHQDQFDEWKSPMASYVKRRLNVYNANFNAVFVGQTGSGKSWAAIRFAEKIDENFNVKKIIFSIKDFLEMINKKQINKGDVLIFDEAGVGVNSKMWYSTINKVCSTTFQTIRNRNFGTLFTSPFASYIDKSIRKLFHCLFLSERILRSQNKSVFKVLNPTYNIYKDKEEFYPYNFVINNQEFRVSKMKFGKPSRKIIRDYEKKKEAFQNELYSTSFQEIQEGADPKENKREIRLNKFKAEIKRVEPIMDQFLKKSRGKEVISTDLLQINFGYSKSFAKSIKTYLEAKWNI